MTKTILSVMLLLAGCSAPMGNESDLLDQYQCSDCYSADDPSEVSPVDSGESEGAYVPIPTGETQQPMPSGGTDQIEPSHSSGGLPGQIDPVGTGGDTATGGEAANPVEPEFELSQGCQDYWDHMSRPGYQPPAENWTVYHCCYEDPSCDLAVDPQPHGEAWAIWWGCSHTHITNLHGQGYGAYDSIVYPTLAAKFVSDLGCH